MPRMTPGDVYAPGMFGSEWKYVDIQVTNLVKWFTQDSNGDGLADGWERGWSGGELSVLTSEGIQQIHFDSITYSYNTGNTVGFIHPDVSTTAQHFFYTSVFARIAGTNDTNIAGYLKNILTWRSDKGSGGGDSSNTITSDCNCIVRFSPSISDISIFSFRKLYNITWGRTNNFSMSLEWQPESTASNNFNNLTIQWKKPVMIDLTNTEFPSLLAEWAQVSAWNELPSDVIHWIFAIPFEGTKTLRLWFMNGALMGRQILQTE